MPRVCWLMGDLASNGEASNGSFGSPSPLSNSQCSVDLAKSSAELQGSTLTLRLAIGFVPAFAGQKSIYMFGPGTGWPLGASIAPTGAFRVTVCERGGCRPGSPEL